MPRVLTVDDSRAIRMIVCKHVRELGFDVDEAEDGEQALDKLRGGTFDLVLLDVTMPVLDGPGMLTKLRESGDRIPVVMLTSEAKRTIVADLVRTGIDDYIVKPFKPDQLTAKIMKALKLRKPIDTPRPRSDEPSIEQRTPGVLPLATKPTHVDGKRLIDFLVVDDMENVARRLRTLIPEHVSLDGVLTAQGALTSCKERIYRVVLVDNDLPDVSSSSFIKPLRMLQPQAAFIALALRSNNKVQDEARDMGFDGVLFKPFDSANIADLLIRYFENNDLVSKDENILRVLSFRGRDSGLDRYFNQISKLIFASVESIADACFGEVILDTTQMPVVPGKVPRLIVAVGERSKQMGLQLRLVGSSDMAKTLKQVTETTNVPFFASLEDALRFEAA